MKANRAKKICFAGHVYEVKHVKSIVYDGEYYKVEFFDENNFYHYWNQAFHGGYIDFGDTPQVGDRLRIIGMDGEPQYTGKEGIVQYIDDIGQIHGTWGGCAVLADKDIFTII